MADPFNPSDTTNSTNSSHQIIIENPQQQEIKVSRATQALARETVETLTLTKESLIRDMSSQVIPTDQIPCYFAKLNEVHGQIQQLADTLNKNVSDELSEHDIKHLAKKAKEIGQERAGKLFDMKQPEVSKILSGK
ncbi:protein of unknown function [Shewanella benthica]|uniref:Uncharacterized protein n=1 Tax=Shewanella benthica TaxID=43661 RepID=A0A330LV65_9GAMM|nr:hypothetical protein [Shewanella benthica]SQH74139.1 protein of unknown function [Shewanella benthica]